MKGHRPKTTLKGLRTDWEDGYEGAQNGLIIRLLRGTERTEKTAMKRYRTDREDDYEGTQN